MTQKASFTLGDRNPDILSCIANLSNDEVFTPPDFVHQMLKTLETNWAKNHGGSSIWENPNIKFLDPCCKSGVFLREVTKRLSDGLKNEIPDLQQRVNHILSEQVFGIAITNLTSLLSRRSVYCSKTANGPQSIGSCFNDESGNIWFERREHSWTSGKCRFCGSKQTIYDRGDSLETHAYLALHTDNLTAEIKEIFGREMQFDVIIGNPPYQLGDGAAGAVPIYHEFVRQAKSLEPKYMCMVTPSRWFAGGNNLDSYRAEMLNDQRIRVLVDYPVSSEVFPGVDVGGGISYFLWDSSFNGDTEVTTIRGGEAKTVRRKLNAHDVFVRDAEALEILEQVLSFNEQSMAEIVSRHAAFGLPTNFKDFSEEKKDGDLTLHYNGGGRMAVRKQAYISVNQISRGHHLVNPWKLFVSEAYRIAERFPNRIVGTPIIAPPGAVCTQTFLVIGGFETEAEAKSAASYYSTKFFRFMLWLRKIGQHASKSVYDWVPIQEWDRTWTDDQLYKKYNLSPDQVDYIERLIKPMDTESAKE